MIGNVCPMSDEGKNPYYGTFQGVANHYPPHNNAYYQPQGYHVLPVHAFSDGRPVRQPRLPCCGLGLGWFLFIIGWFLGGVPWYVGTFILMFLQMDCREKPGLIACAVASFVTVIVVALGVTQGDLGKLT